VAARDARHAGAPALDLRTAGIYVQRHIFAKSRVADLPGDMRDVSPPVILIQYFRMLRFFPDGSVMSLTSPEAPEKAARRLRPDWVPSSAESSMAHPQRGTYVFREHDCTVELALPTLQETLYPLMLSGTQHMTLTLSCTHAGAHNRLHATSNFVVMDDGELFSFTANSSAGIGTAFRYVPLHGFRKSVHLHYPPEVTPDGCMNGWAHHASDVSAAKTKGRRGASATAAR
jgi:hypothetical protein